MGDTFKTTPLPCLCGKIPVKRTGRSGWGEKWFLRECPNGCLLPGDDESKWKAGEAIGSWNLRVLRAKHEKEGAKRMSEETGEGPTTQEQLEEIEEEEQKEESERAAASLTDLAVKFAQAKQRKTDAKTLLDKANADMTALSALMVPLFEKEGCGGIFVADPSIMVSMDRKIYPAWGDATKEERVAALKSSTGHGLISEGFNANSVAAWVRNLPRDENDMPIIEPGLAEVLGVSEVFDVTARVKK